MNQNLLSKTEQSKLTEVSLCAACAGFSPLAKVFDQPKKLVDIFPATGRVVSLPLERTPTVSSSAHITPEFFAQENQPLFRNEWQCVAHVSQIPEPADFITLDLLNEPLILVREKEGAARVLSRICPHHGIYMTSPGFRLEQLKCITRRNEKNLVTRGFPGGLTLHGHLNWTDELGHILRFI